MTGDPKTEGSEARPDPARERPALDPFVAIAVAVSPRARDAIAARDAGARLPDAGASATPTPARSVRTRLKAAARRALAKRADPAYAADSTPKPAAPPPPDEAPPASRSPEDAPTPMRPDAPAPRRPSPVFAGTLAALVVAIAALGTTAWLTLSAPPRGSVDMTVSAVAPTAPPLRRRAVGVAPPARGQALATGFIGPPPRGQTAPPAPGVAPWVGPADVQGAPRIARPPTPRPTAPARD